MCPRTVLDGDSPSFFAGGLTGITEERREPSVTDVAVERRVDTRRALELRLQGCTYAQIGTLLDPSEPFAPQTIHQHLQRFEQLMKDAESLPAFAANRAGLLDSVTFQALSKLSDSLADSEKVQKTPIRDLAVTAAVLIDKRRLEAGESTANIGIMAKICKESDEDLFEKRKGEK